MKGQESFQPLKEGLLTVEIYRFVIMWIVGLKNSKTLTIVELLYNTYVFYTKFQGLIVALLSYIKRFFVISQPRIGRHIFDGLIAIQCSLCSAWILEFFLILHNSLKYNSMSCNLPWCVAICKSSHMYYTCRSILEISRENLDHLQ